MAALVPPKRQRRPQRPTRAGGGHPPTQGGTSKPRASRVNRTLTAQRALGAVRNGLTDRGIDSQLALHLARVLLTRPGVKIEKGGKILYHGQEFEASAFASSHLADIASGKVAEARNQKAIEGDPGYLQAMANLGLARDQSTAGLDAQRKQALIQFGDPSFAGSDALTAGAAAANPFGTSQLLAKQFSDQKLAASNAANRSGVFYGGGEQSGQDQAQRDYASQNQDVTTQLQALLASLDQQNALAQQGYGVGQNQARLDAYNALLASGAIHAATPPNWSAGSYAFKGFANRGRAAAGGGGGGGGQQQGTRAGGLPPGTVYPTGYPGGGPIVYNPAQYGVQQQRNPQVPPVATGGQPPIASYQDMLKRYGVAV
jgi:hypothetical protein